eukprot:1440447-Prymnesium_polylepis.2
MERNGSCHAPYGRSRLAPSTCLHPTGVSTWHILVLRHWVALASSSVTLAVMHWTGYALNVWRLHDIE